MFTVEELCLVDNLSQGARQLLATRGVYFHVIDAPRKRPPAEGDMEWVWGKPERRFL